MPGRHTRLTREIRDFILERLRAGDRFPVACRAANIPESVGSEWLLRGKGEHSARPPAPVFVEFAAEVQRAIDQVEQEAVETWRKAIKGGEKRTKIKRTLIPKADGTSPTGFRYIVTEEQTSEETTFPSWLAARDWLERNLPEFYSPPQKHELSGKDGTPIPVIIMPSAEE